MLSTVFSLVVNIVGGFTFVAKGLVLIGLFTFAWCLVTVVLRMVFHSFIEFLAEDIRGKIISILILLTFILKAIYEIRLRVN